MSKTELNAARRSSSITASTVNRVNDAVDTERRRWFAVGRRTGHTGLFPAESPYLPLD